MYGSLNKKKSKTVLILGSSSDLGLVVAEKFLKAGWKVLAHYNTNKKMLKNLFKQKKNIKLIKADLTKSRSINFFKEQLKNENVVSYINLVGSISNKNYLESSLKTLLNSLKLNTLHPNEILKLILSNMKKKKYGRILNISSIGVKYGGGETSYEYSLSKHLLEFNPKYLRELSKSNILSNVLRVGVTNSKIHKKIKNKNLKSRINLVPMKRAANTDEIADMVYYLASDKNTFITNENITIAGGE